MIDFDGFIPMLDRLVVVRAEMTFFKNNKLLLRWEKCGDYKDVLVPYLVDHIFEEWDEFIEALDGPPGGYGFKLRAEIIDLISCLEMLWGRLDRGDA